MIIVFESKTGFTRLEKSIAIIENGYDGVKEEALAPVLAWLNKR